MIIVFLFCWDRRVQDEIIVSENEIVPSDVPDCDILVKLSLINPVRMKCSLNAYFACLFANELKKSSTYRSAVVRYLTSLPEADSSSHIQIRFVICSPNRHIIDYEWSDLLNHLCREKRELDSALAWLSTLGGAFSALGDNFQTCAEMAGRISVQQLRLAYRLGDPRIMARCRLYYALSLIQRRRLKAARYLVENVYRAATTIHVSDKRLKHMCLGIWTKLRFEWRIKYRSKSKRETST